MADRARAAVRSPAARSEVAAGETILILHNKPVLPADHPEAEAEHDVVDVARVVGRWLRQAGFKVVRLALERDPAPLLRRVRRQRPAAVFNLFEGTAHDPGLETPVAALLEMLELPFTGSPAAALELARAKHLTKYLLAGAGLPTPRFRVVDRLPVPPWPFDWPAIAKPATQDASVGVSQKSVVTSRTELERRVSHLLDTYGPPVLVEEFIAGRELTVALLEEERLRALPFSEILFPKAADGMWPILTYDSKWTPGTAEFDDTPPRCPAEVPAQLSARLIDLACRAFALLGCRDYARVDFRVREDGEPFLLEVNPNPAITPDAGYANCLRAAGIPYRDFLVRIVRNALQRGETPRFAESGVRR